MTGPSTSNLAHHPNDNPLVVTAGGNPAMKPYFGLTFEPVFSREGRHPLDEVEWELRDAVIKDAQGRTIFEQKNVRVPVFWSQTATNIVASKYLHGALGSEMRESGVDDLIHRVASTIREWGAEDGYFRSPEDAETFERELTALLVGQYAAFNSPVWFNVGCDRLEPENRARSWFWDRENRNVVREEAGYRKPQCSACFINSVRDSLESILDLAKTEGMLFKWGSGTGTNFSTIRGSMEQLSGGGTASGPLSFMRGYDAFAGVIKSGGKTRRAAKMAILDVDHPDIEEFIACKSKEERKALALMAAGYDGNGPESEAYASIFYQNANNSVRVTDEFMQLAERGEGQSWPLRARTDGTVVKEVDPARILRQIAEETWRCGDPGMQFDTTINSWHTCPRSGRINASNPCSEYMFLDDSACNLASLNLVKFLQGQKFDIHRFVCAISTLIVAQEILVDHAGYPTEVIAGNSHDYRPLGLGYANLGALLMQLGLPYDSDAGRELAAGITALMGGTAYRTSAKMACALAPIPPANPLLAPGEFGASPGFSHNRENFLRVMGKHLGAAQQLSDQAQSLPGDLRDALLRIWIDAMHIGETWGYRNSQVTVLAPTGTIGFMMDCDTTGIEPMLGIVVHKKLVGGGYLKLVNKAVSGALGQLGYSDRDVAAIHEYILANGTLEGAPGLREEHLNVFDCAFRPTHGSRSIRWQGHIGMMAAVQPFLSGAISKTVNLPQEATVEEIESAYRLAWKQGLKAVAIYRDGSKSSQPVSASADAPAEGMTVPALSGPPHAVRHRLPAERTSLTHRYSVGGHEGYITVGFYPNGQPGEIFLRIAKEGSTMAGLMECFGTAVSVGLQHGVPLEVLCEKFAHTRFEPSGWTGSEELGYANSIMDYIFRWMKTRFLSGTQLPLFQTPERRADREQSNVTALSTHTAESQLQQGDAPACPTCGSLTRRTGSCFACPECGRTQGCS